MSIHKTGVHAAAGGQLDYSLSEPLWFCVQTQSKREHIAASNLRQDAQVEVLLPRIRYRHSTRRGPAWVTEALFPGYVFARFLLPSLLRRVQSLRGVRGVVHFGHRWPSIPDSVIAELRAIVGDAEIKILTPELNAGDSVEVATGVFQGFQALVARVTPRRQRVSVLLDFLGRQTAVELSTNQVVQPGQTIRASVVQSTSSLKRES
ncbi:MAG TPA: transcription termination/antitermination NusG family protein [Verrucomicrobiae bacterium]|nr:transcription termination/antitermination NusG family protein [Verrucomicrobiae bacterium]